MKKPTPAVLCGAVAFIVGNLVLYLVLGWLYASVLPSLVLMVILWLVGFLVVVKLTMEITNYSGQWLLDKRKCRHQA